MCSTTYKALVLEGGGPKGLAYWGLLECLNNNSLLRDCHFFAGSSIGALFSLICALELKQHTINKIMMDTNFKNLIDIQGLWIWEIIKGLWNWGIDNGSKVEDMILKIISLKYKGDPKKMTFAELKSLTGNSLIVTGTNLNTRRGKVFSPIHTPNAFVFRKVHISMAFPGAFEPVLEDGDLWADGGIYDNFPIKELLKLNFKPDEILGAKLITPDETTANPDTIFNGRKEVTSKLQLALAIVETMQVSRENQDLRPGFWDHIIPLHVETRNIFEIDFTDKEKKKFKEDAIIDTEKFLSKRGLLYISSS